jgi:hypothetical protein
MKKLVIAAMAVVLSAGVNAQQDSAVAGGTSGVAGVGGLSVATLTAIGVSAAVAAAIVSNNSGATIIEGQEFDLVCKSGDTGPVGGVCTNVSTTTATATASATGTVTNTITVVPVTSTYPAIVVPRT